MLEANFKIFSQWYRTLVLLHRYFPNTSDRCWCCREEHETLLHIFWSCSRIEGYWREVWRIIKKFSDCEIPEDPTFFLLHNSKIPVKTFKNSILCHLLNAAKSSIPLTWRQIQMSSVGLWLRKVEEQNQMEDLVWTTRQRHM